LIAAKQFDNSRKTVIAQKNFIVSRPSVLFSDIVVGLGLSRLM